MFLAHAWRVQDHDGPVPDGAIGWLDRTLTWMDRGVAYVAASFLFIAGFSLVLAHRDALARGRSGFLGATLRRAGWLYLLSAAMFLPEHGVVWPDLVTSSGILPVIAVAVTVTAIAMSVPRPVLALTAAATLILATTYALERANLSVAGLNAGPGGAIPLVMYAAVGAVAGRVYLTGGVRPIAWAAAATTPLSVGAWLHEDAWLAYYTSVYPNHGGLAVADWFGLAQPGTHPVALSFWNPSALGALGLLAPPHAGWTLVLLVALTVASVALALAVASWKTWPPDAIAAFNRRMPTR